MLFVVLGIFLCLLIYYFTRKSLYFWKNKGVKQGPFLKVLLFNFFCFFKRESAADIFQTMYNEVPGSRYSGFLQFNVPNLVIKDPDLIKQMLVKDFEHFSDHREFVPEDCDSLWGRNLFALKGRQWRHMRSTLTPSFTSAKMKAMFILMRDCAENFVQYFLKKEEDLAVIEMKDIFTRYCNDVIATTAFGIEVDSLANPENEFYCMGRKTTDFSKISKQLRILALFFVPYFAKLFNAKWFEDDVRTFFGNLILDAIKVREERGIVRPDLIHLLMEARKDAKENENDMQEKTKSSEKENYPREITDEDIIAQSLVFFFAGFDSVSTAMCFMAHELAVNPDIQEKLMLEIKETSQMHQGKLTYDALVNMKYMEMVVSETLRKWPALVGYDRVCTKPYTIEPVLSDEKPVHFQKGEYMFVPVHSIHHNPDLFPNPERFDPERFSEENKVNIKSCSYLPFGTGPRNCIGSRFAMIEIKVVFYYILSNFEIVPVEKTKIPLVLAKNIFQYGAEGGFWLGLKRLKK